MKLELKIMLAGAIFLGGWLWSYFFMRQLLFNFLTANPLIKKMNSLKPDLIAIGAKRYTTTSTIVCFVLAAVILFAVLRFCPLYLQIGFGVGALLAVLILIKKATPDNRSMFDSFCTVYCRFVPDDELRTAMYNKKTGQIKARLKEMELEGSFVPDFKKE